MRSTMPAVRENASEVVAANCIEFSIVAESCKWFPGLSKKLWPGKPAAAVHHLTKEPERSCYAWVEGKNDPPARALLRLLDSDQGWRVLEYLMRGSKQAWWRETARARRCADAYEREREQLELNL